MALEGYKGRPMPHMSEFIPATELRGGSISGRVAVGVRIPSLGICHDSSL